MKLGLNIVANGAHAAGWRMPEAQADAVLNAGSQHYWCGARDQRNLWHFDKPARNGLHPTMKQVALVERAIRNSRKQRDTVLDLFGGSGTTMIAAEDGRGRFYELAADCVTNSHLPSDHERNRRP